MNIREIFTVINEGVWALPDSDKKLKALYNLIQRPILAKHAAKTFNHIIGTDALRDLLTTMAEEDPEADVRGAVFEYLQTAYPEIYHFLKNDDSMLRDENIEGTLSPLGHKDETK